MVLIKITSDSYVNARKFGGKPEEAWDEAFKQVDAVFQDLTKLADEFDRADEIEKRDLEGVGSAKIVPLTRIFAKKKESLQEVRRLLEEKGFKLIIPSDETLDHIDVKAHIDDVWYLDCFERICP